MCVCLLSWLVIVDAFIGFFMIFFFKQKTAYEMRISDWSSDVCSSDLLGHLVHATNSFTALALPSAGCGPGADRANCARAAACAILRTSPREPAPAVA